MKTIYVFDGFSDVKPVHMGNLYVDVIKGNETYSFEYSEEWLKKNNENALSQEKYTYWSCITLHIDTTEYYNMTISSVSNVRYAAGINYKRKNKRGC